VGFAELEQQLAALPLVKLLLELQRLERALVVDRGVLVASCAFARSPARVA
jgi:hypothetical protein